MKPEEACCEDWKELVPIINGYIHLAKIHGQGDWKNRKAFVYCPWCGKKREEPTNKGVNNG
jgi:hypothetical protein